MNGRLYFLNNDSPDRPTEEKYVVDIEGLERKSFIFKKDAMIFMFDNGITTFHYLTKEISEYINTGSIRQFELWHIENRVGYVIYDNEAYVDENDKVKHRKSYIWRFIGFGKPCFAENQELLKEKVKLLIAEHKKDKYNLGLNEYPYFTKYHR